MIKKTEPTSKGNLVDTEVSLEKKGKCHGFQANTIKQTLSLQLEQAMSENGISQVTLAKGMKTSPAQVRRLLNPKYGNVTLNTLQKAANIVGRKVRLELI
jgi:antitoxin HicB